MKRKWLGDALVWASAIAFILLVVFAAIGDYGQ
jgi:hypothetical protein